MRYSNELMEMLLKDILKNKGVQTKKNVELSTLMQYLWPKFYEVNDCILVDLGNLNDGYYPNIVDRTAFEANENHIHIDSIITEFKKRPKDGFRFGYKLCEIWGTKLKAEFPMKRFHIILSYDGRYTTLRFHTKHHNELNWIDIDNINNYKDAVLVFEI